MKSIRSISIDEYVIYVMTNFKMKTAFFENQKIAVISWKIGATVQNICDIDTKLLKKTPFLSIMG